MGDLEGRPLLLGLGQPQQQGRRGRDLLTESHQLLLLLAGHSYRCYRRRRRRSISIRTRGKWRRLLLLLLLNGTFFRLQGQGLLLLQQGLWSYYMDMSSYAFRT